jgi:hypothetical protein
VLNSIGGGPPPDPKRVHVLAHGSESAPLEALTQTVALTVEVSHSAASGTSMPALNPRP